MSQTAINKVVCRLVQSCVGRKHLSAGKRVRFYVSRAGWEAVSAGRALMNMYIRLGNLQEARKVFDNLSTKDLLSWNTMVAGYAKHDRAEDAVKLLEEMVGQGVRPNRLTFLRILKKCLSTAGLMYGKTVHAKVIEVGFCSDMFVGSALVDMYSKCGRIEDARRVFDSLPATDSICWNSMIGAYAQHGHGEEALFLYHNMDLPPDKYTFVSILKACSRISALEEGKLIHGLVVENHLEGDKFIGSTLIDMYAQAGCLKDAFKVFGRLPKKDVVVLTSMATAYAQLGDGQGALDLYLQMRRDGIHPNAVTFLSIIKACIIMEDLEWGRLVHSHIRLYGFESDVFLGSTLIDMYAKCGNLEYARDVFDHLSTRNVVSWTAMIGGYALHGHGQEALQLFEEMGQQSLHPNKRTLVSLLKACSSIAALNQGKVIHHLIVDRGLESEPYVSSSIIDMYAKCGSLEDARTVFDRLPKKDLITWNAMISGEVQHGQAQKAFQLFEQMQNEGTRPCEATFGTLLSACSHANLLDVGRLLLCSMCQVFGITPQTEHYASMVDLLCHAGHLYEALNFIYQMPCEPDVLIWKSLLWACRRHSEVELGRLSFEKILKLDSTNIAAHVLMAQLYGAAGRVEDETEVREMMQALGMKKEPGRSWLELENKVHNFMVEDKDHPERKRICSVLETLNWTITRTENPI